MNCFQCLSRRYEKTYRDSSTVYCTLRACRESHTVVRYLSSKSSGRRVLRVRNVRTIQRNFKKHFRFIPVQGHFKTFSKLLLNSPKRVSSAQLSIFIGYSRQLFPEECQTVVSGGTNLGEVSPYKHTFIFIIPFFSCVFSSLLPTSRKPIQLCSQSIQYLLRFAMKLNSGTQTGHVSSALQLREAFNLSENLCISLKIDFDSSFRSEIYSMSLILAHHLFSNGFFYLGAALYCCRVGHLKWYIMTAPKK